MLFNNLNGYLYNISLTKVRVEAVAFPAFWKRCHHKLFLQQSHASAKTILRESESSQTKRAIVKRTILQTGRKTNRAKEKTKRKKKGLEPFDQTFLVRFSDLQKKYSLQKAQAGKARGSSFLNSFSFHPILSSQAFRLIPSFLPNIMIISVQT